MQEDRSAFAKKAGPSDLFSFALVMSGQPPREGRREVCETPAGETRRHRNSLAHTVNLCQSKNGQTGTRAGKLPVFPLFPIDLIIEYPSVVIESGSIFSGTHSTTRRSHKLP